MPPPLTSDGQVTYADGTKPTVDQMAKDVAAFLVWTAEPKLENRHAAGLAVVDLPAVRDDPRLSRLPATSGPRRSARSASTGALDPENQAKSRRAKAKAGRRRLSAQIQRRFIGSPRDAIQDRWRITPLFWRLIMRIPHLRLAALAWQRPRARRLRLRLRHRYGYGGGYGGYGVGYRSATAIAATATVYAATAAMAATAMAGYGGYGSPVTAGTTIIIIPAPASTFTTAIAAARLDRQPAALLDRTGSATSSDRHDARRVTRENWSGFNRPLEHAIRPDATTAASRSTAATRRARAAAPAAATDRAVATATTGD